ncbi:MAG: tetratricopeptide repeat protein [Lentisphaerae bacterium]|nr:tetratricopeptide repeat protein [Lentisphaerota bacterium]MBT4821066.1 tetratricopeptide repeat protein [Lentisphaerota bacterium]MBT5610415.1 tetratricopeptide repeat protein [Lentisphaerota bacterium]MBT7061669.1 tetratricopeptide repeat protein [Lentisphaerota bacterium]
MKIAGIAVAALVACVVMIMPISAFMVRQGLKNKEKPGAAKMVFRAANIRMTLFQYGAAAKIMQKGLQTFPDYNEKARATYRIGLCYEKGGRPADAKKWYEQYLKQWPKHTWAQQAQTRIQKIDLNNE